MFLDMVFLASKGLSAADAVIAQMESDYPSNSLKWMKKYDWNWPVAVPVSKIDISNKKQWKAKSSDSKVERFKKKITSGVMKPIVLVRPKGSSKYVVVDGHHRVLTCIELGRPVMAWTVDVDKEKGPWDELHDVQNRNKKGGGLSMTGIENINRICLAADSMAKASTPEPFSTKPLWHKKDPSFHLPYY